MTTQALENITLPPVVEKAMQQMIHQIDVLSQTVSILKILRIKLQIWPDSFSNWNSISIIFGIQVSILEQRLSLVENKTTDLILKENIESLQISSD